MHAHLLHGRIRRIFSALFLMLAVCSIHLKAQTTTPTEVNAASIQILPAKSSYATMLNPRHPGNRLGYRFHEHTPIAYGIAPTSAEAQAGLRANNIAKLEREFRQSPGVFVFEHEQPATTDWIRQDWLFHMRPVADGVELLWIITTLDTGLPRYYGVQQCFRLSGQTNAQWRQEIALAPAFSESDLWTKQQAEAEKTSLTYVVRSGKWQSLPAEDTAVGARTPLGIDIDRRRSAGQLPERVGLYQARMLAPIDDGLIARTNLDETWVTGLYWQRTSHVTDHHPADCLHAIVNIGDIPPNSRRALRGKIYWFAGDKQELLERHRRDFNRP